MWKLFKKFIWKIFRITKKEKEEIKIKKPKSVMDFSDIKFDFNIKSICYFEKLMDKSFFEMDDKDIMDMIYSIYMVNNPDKKMKREIFMNILKREDILRWMIKQYTDSVSIWEQFKNTIKKELVQSNDDTSKVRMIDYITTLIIEYGVDAHYIYYEMDVWELGELYEAIDTKLKKDIVDKRFWTYLQMIPHIDTKKCKSPEALLSFEWEKEAIKKKQETDIKNNMYAIKNMIGRNIFGEKEEKNG